MSETLNAPGSSAEPVPPARRQDNMRASLLLIMAMVMFTSETLLVRLLNDVSSPTQVVLFRGLAQLAVVGAWMVWRRQGPRLKTPHLMLHLARGLVSIIGWFLYYRSFQKLDLALATLLSFASALFVVALARPVLGEQVRPISWVATMAGFGGIALAADFGGSAATGEVVLGLLGAFFASLIVFLTRKLAVAEDTVTIMTFIGLIVTAAAIPIAFLTWQPLTITTALVLSCGSVLGALGMILMIEAYSMGEAAVLAPISYLRLALAMIFAYLVLSEVPSQRMVLGAAIVVVSALVAMHAEHRRIQRLTRTDGIDAGPIR